MLIPPQGPYPHPQLGVTAPQCCVKSRLNGAGRHSTECGEGIVAQWFLEGLKFGKKNWKIFVQKPANL